MISAVTIGLFLLGIVFSQCHGARMWVGDSLRDVEVVDLTHTLDEHATKYPLETLDVTDDDYYLRETWKEGWLVPNTTWLRIGGVSFYGHMGTHLDAPSHFAKDGDFLHQIDKDLFLGPLVVIDIKSEAASDANYTVTVDDLEDYEDEYGEIPDGAVVVLNSGWDAKYPDPEQVFGTADVSNVFKFQFPGFSFNACQWLLNNRNISMLGTDTASVDPGQMIFPYPCKSLLQPAQIPLLEYLANLDDVPVNGANIVIGAPKIRDGSAVPCRALAFIVDDDDDSGSSSEDK